MNIKHENVPGQVQEVIFEINREDYAADLEAALKKQRRTAQVPGFRAGNAPMGMIKKMYEKTLLVEEVDRLINTKMDEFMKENKVKFIFEPLPIEEKSVVNFENPDNFVFAYEYALAPEFEIDFAKLPVVEDYKLVPSDDDRAPFIKQLRERHGNYVTPETIDAEDSLSVKYGEDKDGFFFIRDLNEDAQKLFIGKKVDETVSLSLRKAFSSEFAMARFMKVEQKDLEAENEYQYDLTVKHIGRIELAEMNDEFFKKAYPDGSVTNMEQLNKVADQSILEQWEPDMNRKFMNDAIEMLLANVDVELPQDFVKRYILAVQKDMTEETLNERFEEYLKSFKWQMIETKLTENSDIHVGVDDIKDYFRQYFVKNYFGNFNMDDLKERLDVLVNQAMENKENVKAVYDLLFDQKLAAFLREKLNLSIAEGDTKAYIDMLTAQMKGEAPAKKAPAKKAPAKKACAKKAAPKAEEETEAKAEKPAKAPAKKTTTKKTTKETK